MSEIPMCERNLLPIRTHQTHQITGPSECGAAHQQKDVQNDGEEQRERREERRRREKERKRGRDSRGEEGRRNEKVGSLKGA